MPNLLSCSQGHQWEHELDSSTSALAHRSSCPICGEIVESVEPTIEATRSVPVPDGEATSAYAGASGATTSVSDATGLSRRERFTIVKSHARGGLGEVSIATDADIGREVALKEMRVEYRTSISARERFLNEAMLTGQLEHPGIVPIYAVEQDEEGVPRYAMRFVHGKTFRQAIREHHQAPSNLSLRDLLSRYVDICQAVAYAHNKNVIHRDLKPDNVMLGEFGETFVLDWGLAKSLNARPAESARPLSTESEQPPDTQTDTLSLAVESSLAQSQAPEQESPRHSSDLTRAGQILGTPSYMSPEQARGEIDRIGKPADVYSLGAILYEILVGHAQFGHDRSVSALKAVQTSAPPRPRLLAPHSSPSLEAVCLKAMGREPEDRYAGVSELADEIERWLADEPVLIRREPLLHRASRWVRRHRTIAFTSAALLFTSVVALSIGMVLLRQEQRRTQNARDLETDAKVKALASNQEALVAKEDALEQLGLAQRQYRRARTAVEQMLTEVASKDLRDIPYVSTVQRRLLQKALSFYQEFLAEHGNDLKLKQETGHAYARVATIQEQLGNEKEAGPNFVRAIELLKEVRSLQPDKSEPTIELAAAYFRQGSYLSGTPRLKEAQLSYEQGDELLQGLPPAEENTLDIQILRADGLTGLGQVLRNLGEQRQAQVVLNQAGELFQRLATTDADRAKGFFSLTNNYQARAELHTEMGELQHAGDLLDEVRTLVLDVGTGPLGSTRSYHAVHAKMLHSRAINLLHQAEIDRAISQFEQAIRVTQSLVETYPLVPSYREMLAASHHQLASALTDRRQYEKARPHAVKSLVLLTQLISNFPDAPAYQFESAGSRMLMGLIEVQLGDSAEAEKQLLQAVEGLESIKDQLIELPQFRIRLAGSHHTLGMVRLRQGKLADAGKGFKASIELLKDLKTPDRKDVQAAMDTAGSMLRLGQLLAEHQQIAESIEILREALQRLVSLNEESPGIPALEILLAATHHHLGDALYLNGDIANGRKELVDSEKLLARLVQQHQDARQFRRDYANTLGVLGSLEVQAGQLDKANARLLAAIKEFEILEPLDKDLPEQQINYASVLHNRGMHAFLRGDLKGAESSFRSSIERLTKVIPELPGVPKPRRDLANSLLRLGGILVEKNQTGEGLKILQQSQEHFTELNESSVASPMDRQQLAAAYHQEGTTYLSMRNSSKGVPAFEKAVEILKKLANELPDAATIRRDLANSLMFQGFLYLETGEVPKAELQLIAALAEFKKLGPQFDSDPAHQIRVAGAHHNLAVLRQQTGNKPVAMEGYRESIAILEPLAKSTPQFPKIRIDLAGSKMRLANVLADSGQVDEGVKLFKDVHQLYEDLVKNFPRAPLYQVQLAAAHHNLGNIYLDNDRYEESLKCYRASIAQLKNIVRDFGTHPQVVMDMAGSLCASAVAYNKLKDHDKATIAIQESVKTWKSLQEKMPDIERVNVALGNAINEQGVTLLRQSEPKKAQQHFEEARTLQLKVLKKNPKSSSAQACLVEETANLAEALIRQNEHRKAIQLAVSLREELTDKAEAFYGAAIISARCVKQWNLGADFKDRAELIREQSDASMKSLAQAIEHGFSDLNKLQKDDDLKAFRESKEMKAIEEKLKKK